jgi:hypothetical protein
MELFVKTVAWAAMVASAKGMKLIQHHRVVLFNCALNTRAYCTHHTHALNEVEAAELGACEV